MKVRILRSYDYERIEKEFNHFAKTVDVLNIIVKEEVENAGMIVYHILYTEKETDNE